MDFGLWILDAIERVGLPVTFLIIGVMFYFMAQRQSSKRDTDNAKLHITNTKLHETTLRVQERQNEILDRLVDNIHNDHDDIKTSITTTAKKIEGAVVGAKTEVVELVRDNHKITVSHFENLFKELEKLPTIIRDSQATYNDKVGNGLQSIITEFKNVFSLIQSEKKSHEDAKDFNVVVPNRNDVDG